jgi:hypothetical protein
VAACKRRGEEVNKQWVGLVPESGGLFVVSTLDFFLFFTVEWLITLRLLPQISLQEVTTMGNGLRATEGFA